jgi:hypothetical protein
MVIISLPDFTADTSDLRRGKNFCISEKLSTMEEHFFQIIIDPLKVVVELYGNAIAAMAIAG